VKTTAPVRQVLAFAKKEARIAAMHQASALERGADRGEGVRRGSPASDLEVHDRIGRNDTPAREVRLIRFDEGAGGAALRR
jgi:hypothetical protein